MNKTNIVMIIIMCSQGKKGTIYSYSEQKGLSEDIFRMENIVRCIRLY